MRKYASHGSNKIDMLAFISNLVYYIIMIATPESPVCYYPTPVVDIEIFVDLCSFILILRVIIVFFALAKIQLFMYIYEDYGILTVLFVSCKDKILPFFILLNIWLFSFAITYLILGVNF